jgi:hypothetical protein
MFRGNLLPPSSGRAAKKVKVHLQQTMKAQMESRGIALLFL